MSSITLTYAYRCGECRISGILLSESDLRAIRRAVEPALCRVAELWLRLHRIGERAEIVWEDINLQDMVEEARAELYWAQAEKLRRET